MGPSDDALPATDTPAPRYTVVIPTFERRDVVVGSVTALVEQRYDPGFEVVVVVDGSTDGTAAALRALQVPFPLQVVEQPNLGAARARNNGARCARGEVLLFLDDDMRAAADLLSAHDRAHARGADVVVGHVPLDPSSPRTFLAAGVGEWADRRARRLEQDPEDLTFADLLTGQLSVRRELFWAVGGFDEDFTRDGSFGREDTDFGRRVLAAGHRVVFAADAVSRQHYVVGPRSYLRQWHQAGQADVAYLRKHPDDVGAVWRDRRPEARWNRFVWRPMTRSPRLAGVVAAAARPAVAAAAARSPEHQTVRRWFFRIRDLEYWRGVRRAGGMPAAHALRVLCYHSVSDLGGDPVLEQYGVPPGLLRRQLLALRRAGFTFVSLDEVLRFVGGAGGLPRKPLLVTFDDGYVDLLEHGVPVLTELRVPAVAFAVTGLVGGTNSWDEAQGASTLPLLDAAGLRSVVDAGVAVGAHGRSHRVLTGLSGGELDDETAGARSDLEAIGIPQPRVFSYPYGEHDPVVRSAVAAAGMSAAFTVRPGVVHQWGADLYQLPRIEVTRADGSGVRLLAKVVLARPAPRTPRAVSRARARFRRP